MRDAQLLYKLSTERLEPPFFEVSELGLVANSMLDFLDEEDSTFAKRFVLVQSSSNPDADIPDPLPKP